MKTKTPIYLEECEPVGRSAPPYSSGFNPPRLTLLLAALGALFFCSLPTTALAQSDPTAVIEGPTSGLTGQPLQWDASGSSDEDGFIVYYFFDFDDGTNHGSQGWSGGHAYADPGTYEVALQVVDNELGIGMDTISVEITTPGFFVPSGLNPGDEYRIAFVTENDGDRNATSTDIADYNTFVTDEANKSGFTGGVNYFAVASTETVDARDNIGSSAAPIYLVNDTLLANGTDDLWDGDILAEFRVDQFAVILDKGDTDIWTGSQSDGTAFPKAFLGSAEGARFGQVQSLTSGWISGATKGSDEEDSFYGISEVLTVPTGEPDPSPVAEAGGPYGGAAGETITFDGSASVDPDGYIGYAFWDFGDSSPTVSGLTATHVYTTSGPFTATLTVGDNDDLTDTDDASVTITVGTGNQAPIADPGGPYLATAGTALSFDGTGSTDPDGTIISYTWTFGDGMTGMGVSPEHTYATADTYTVYLEVEDENGAVSGASTTVEVSDTNHPPMADAGGPYSGSVGEPIAFVGAGSDPNGADDIASYEWNFGDGSPPTTGQSVTYAYQAGGQYTATLTVRDSQGTTGMDTAPVSIDVPEQPPSAKTGGPYSGSIGKPVTFDASSSNDPDGAIASYQWTFGDGNSGSGMTTTHSYATTGPFFVTLTVRDKDSNTDSEFTFAVIGDGNQAPVAHAGGPYSGETLAAVQFTGTVEDEIPGTVTGEWDFGDGTPKVDGLTASHTYGDEGVYTVTFTATDVEGLVGADSTQATIGQGDQPPTAVAGGPYRAKAGTPIGFDGSISSDLDGQIVSYHWTFGDGASADGPTPSHTYSTPGPYEVTLTVTDDDDVTGTDTTVSLISGDNLPPTAVIDGPTSGRTGQSLVFDGTGSSDEDGSIHHYTWDFDDGTTGTGGQTGHAFATAGTYNVTLEVIDNQGGIGTASLSVEITAPEFFVPSNLNPGIEYRIAFVTDGVRDATSTDIADYNTFVTEQANQSGLTGGVNYFAVASTETVNAIDNIGSSTAPIYLPNGTLLANGTDDLWDGEILEQFRVDQFAVFIDRGDTNVWTGSQSDGTAAPDTFLGSRRDATFGQVQFTDGEWISLFTEDSAAAENFYAISEVLTVPGAPIQLKITSWTPAAGGGMELTLELKGEPDTDYQFYSSSELIFDPGTPVENLSQDDPTNEPGTVTGANLLTTDSNGDGTVSMTLPGARNFVVAVSAP